MYRFLGVTWSRPVIEDSDGSTTTDRIIFHPADDAEVDVDDRFLVDLAHLDSFGINKRGVACCEAHHSCGKAEFVFNFTL